MKLVHHKYNSSVKDQNTQKVQKSPYFNYTTQNLRKCSRYPFFKQKAHDTNKQW